MSAHIVPPSGSYFAKPEASKCPGYGALITGLALVVLACCLANGCFTPGIQAHIASYGAAVLTVLSIIPFSVAASVLCASPTPPEKVRQV